MTVFVDPKDDSAYVLYSSEANATLYIAKLNDDYTNVVKTTNVDQSEDKSSTLLTGSTHTFLQTVLRMPRCVAKISKSSNKMVRWKLLPYSI